MKIYRIAKEKYIKDLSGTGAKLYGGRWNPKGVALLYTSEYKSLAALEVLVHLDRQTAPDDLKILCLEIPDKGIITFDEEQFNFIKAAEDANHLMLEAGKQWIEGKKSLALKVPSILIEGECNILINPEFPTAMELIKIQSIHDFLFDERFFI